jgi:hypothetical protein
MRASDIQIHTNCLHRLYGIVEPFYFRNALKEWRIFTSTASGSSDIESISISLRCFPGLLFQVLAITLLFLPSGARIEELPEVDYLELSQRYTDIGLDLIHLLGHQGTTIVTVQHDLLRAAWLKNRGHGGEAWHALSNSIRFESVMSCKRFDSHQVSGKPKNSIYTEVAKPFSIHRGRNSGTANGKKDCG